MFVCVLAWFGGAAEHPLFRDFCVKFGNFVNSTTLRFEIYLLGHKAREVGESGVSDSAERETTLGSYAHRARRRTPLVPPRCPSQIKPMPEAQAVARGAEVLGGASGVRVGGKAVARGWLTMAAVGEEQ